MSNANVLFLAGWNQHRSKLESLNYNQSTFKSVLQSSGWNVHEAPVTDANSVVEAYARFEGMPLLVVYTGHGDGGTPTFYPRICPVHDPIDLRAIKRTGTTSYIFDCCNVNDGEKELFIKTENHGTPVFFTQCLDPTQGFIICMRKQVCGFTRGTGTVLNLAMCSAMYHFQCFTIGHLAMATNGYCNVEYKKRNYITNKGWKYVIELNGGNPGSSSVRPEASFHTAMSNIKWPEVQLPKELHLNEKGLELIEHLMDRSVTIHFEIERDESEDLEVVDDLLDALKVDDALVA